jgi:beta-phosphoglucomutase-like phosphatase (HAD superfamily)
MSPRMRFVRPTQSYKGYIFDCDGTLVESMPLHFRAWRQAFQEHAAPFDFDWELFTSRAGMPLEETVVALNQQFSLGLDPSGVVAVQRATYRTLLSEVTAIEIVADFAREVARHAPVSVASGGHRDEVEASLRNIGLLGIFKCVVTATEVTRGKPDPEILLRCAEGMGVLPRDCLVVEDGALGIEAARRAGMDWVKVEGLAPVTA